MLRIGRVGAVQPADIGDAGPVRCRQVAAGLVLAELLDRGALGQARVRWSVQPHVETAFFAKNDGGSAAQDHPGARGCQAQDVLFAAAAQVLLLMARRRR
jgi:hypothetical protein